MPYTSPQTRSQASSISISPCTSRRSSLQAASYGATKSDLPRSTSYLAHHRRSASVKTPHNSKLEPLNDSPSANNESTHSTTTSSLRQSPCPITKDRRIPASAIISPPESTNNSSDDESNGREIYENRGRSLKNLTELQSAIRDIEQNRESSLTRALNQTNKQLELLIPDTPGQSRISDVSNTASMTSDEKLDFLNHQLDVEKNTTRSSLNPEVMEEETLVKSDDEILSDGDEPLTTPKSSMVRKKSGELVRPALRTPFARRRPSSMPGTPTFSKAVHFDAQLEHIRHFLQIDRPLAVSAGSSPVPAYDNDYEFPFGEDHSRESPYEWEIIISNFPPETPLRLAQPVRVERVFLSYDNKTLVGSVAVANLAFCKSVIVRFTLDYWKTTSEVVAEFNQDIRQLSREGYDRFNFNINLADQANLESKTMFFCVKYCVNGMEYWDNNNSTNFKVDFRKKVKPRSNEKRWSKASQMHSNSFLHTNPRSTVARPKSMSHIFDDYADEYDGRDRFSNFKLAVDDYIEDSRSIRLKGPKLCRNLSSDSQFQNIGHSNGNVFGNRYDFGVSLTAAMNGSNKSSYSEKSLLSINLPTKTSIAPSEPVSPTSDVPQSIAGKSDLLNTYTSQENQLTCPPAGLSKPCHSSQSYNDILDKYCFFGSVKSSPYLEDGSLFPRQSYVADKKQHYYDSKESSVSSSSSTGDSYRISGPLFSTIGVHSPSVTTMLAGNIIPKHRNLHEVCSFLETHSGTAIRGQ